MAPLLSLRARCPGHSEFETASRWQKELPDTHIGIREERNLVCGIRFACLGAALIVRWIARVSLGQVHVGQPGAIQKQAGGNNCDLPEADFWPPKYCPRIRYTVVDRLLRFQVQGVAIFVGSLREASVPLPTGPALMLTTWAEAAVRAEGQFHQN